jgi:hypothetical protein
MHLNRLHVVASLLAAYLSLSEDGRDCLEGYPQSLAPQSIETICYRGDLLDEDLVLAW